MNKKIFPRLIFLGIAVVFVFTSCGGKKKSAMKTPEETVFTVQSEAVSVEEITTYIDVHGDIEAKDKVDIYPDMAGTLVNLPIVLGSKVRKGQMVAQVDPSAPGVRYTLSRVDAPISGSIVSVPMQVGAKVSTQTPIATVGDTSSLQISTSVTERYVGILQEGLVGMVSLEAYPDEAFPAKVVRISPIVDPISRTKQIHLEFDDFDDRINAGMFAKVRLFIKTIPDAMVVPSLAVQISLDEHIVYVVNGNRVERRVVKVGETVGNKVQILEGLTGTERVVVQGIQVLSDGAAIKDIATNNSGDTAANTSKDEASL